MQTGKTGPDLSHYFKTMENIRFGQLNYLHLSPAA